MTLIAAWKLPVHEDDADPIGVRIVSDSLLSQPQGAPITPIWKKVYTLKPVLRVPRGARDQDWWEVFSHYDYVSLKPIGMFFAGSSLAFTFAQVAVRELVEELGLKAFYEEDGVDERGEPKWKHVETRIVRHSQSDQFRWSGQDSIYEPLYYPPPKLDLAFIAMLVCEELDRFYASIPGGAVLLGGGGIQYAVTIGLVGYCEATSSFRLFEIKPEAKEGRDPAYPEVRMCAREIPGDEMALWGRTDLRDMIEQRLADEAANPRSLENSDAEHQSVARQSVMEDIIQNNPPAGVGGGLIRAEVTRGQGFQLVETPWNPAVAKGWRELF
jgi:hypothetical protein